eukprot:TRINITY_DN1679_c0_g1_i1.p1 TRINITY_DN1679_c0_g1~~TRINITY_DN1679_c0_g1_i1.p1  ORF type:complete len:106 (-),score=7.56 TRINITY_DN1679_c0_g1_i1:53-370(-)
MEGNKMQCSFLFFFLSPSSTHAAQTMHEENRGGGGGGEKERKKKRFCPPPHLLETEGERERMEEGRIEKWGFCTNYARGKLEGEKRKDPVLPHSYLSETGGGGGG